MASGTITDSDADDEKWKSQTYVIEVREGVPYSFELTGLDYDTAASGIPRRKAISSNLT